MEQNFFQKNKTMVVVGGIIILVLVWAMGAYNSLVGEKEGVTAQWAQVDNQLQRRFDLIPNIVATVKGVSKQEQDVFGALAQARTQYSGATTIDEKTQIASRVQGDLGRLLVIAENYPTLQSSQAYRDLIVSLEGTENRIGVERMRYNDLVRSYNTHVKTFPTSLFASVFGFSQETYFEVAETAKVNPKVDFAN